MSNLSQFANGGMTYKGAYNAGTTYKINNVVTSGSKTYVCKVPSCLGVAVTDTGTWAVLAESSALAVSNIGAGVNPATFILQASGATIIFNKVS